ncbi:amidohydrolase [Allofournierella sp.]|uniref:amidohydrolase n=1 Tax=Allofournierella sp. TaxID=1940256 RepID=UPI003AB701ED
MQADLILKSTAIFTSTADTAFAGAVAVKGGKIAYVGPAAGAAPLQGPGTRVLDLGDQLIAPGFHDSHLHFFLSAIYASPYVVFCEGRSEQECVDALAPLAAVRPKEEWLVCHGWYHPLWADPREPSKKSLDAQYPDRPVAMTSGDLHTLWLNSKGLERLGITPDSVPPQGGRYGKDENGRLTGLLYEAASDEALPKVFAFPEAELCTAYHAFIKKLNAQGITSVCDMSTMAGSGPDLVREDIYRQLEAAGQLTLRVHMFPTLLDDLSRPQWMRRTFTGGRLRFCGVKQFSDGVSSTHTAYLKEPYSNACFPGDRGCTVTPPETLRRLVLKAAGQGFAVRIHTIGDEAVHEALDYFQEAREKYGPLCEGQNCLEHLENFQPADIARLKELDVLAACQPPHLVLDPDGVERDLGPRRAKYMWPFHTYEKLGVKYAFGTDSPVVGIDSMNVIYDAVTRQSPVNGYPEGGWQPHEKITVAQALRAYTRGSAMAAGRLQDLGTLEEGKLADLVVLSKNLLAVDPGEILSTIVVMTLVGGEVVYQVQ